MRTTHPIVRSLALFIHSRVFYIICKNINKIPTIHLTTPPHFSAVLTLRQKRQTSQGPALMGAPRSFRYASSIRFHFGNIEGPRNRKSQKSRKSSTQFVSGPQKRLTRDCRQFPQSHVMFMPTTFSGDVENKFHSFRGQFSKCFVCHRKHLPNQRH